MTKDEESYEKFKFTELQLGELKVLLGSSQSVEAFIGNVEGWINQAIWVRDKDNYGLTTLSQMKGRLLEYERLCATFVQGMSAIDVDLGKNHDQEGEKDWRTTMKIEAASLTYKNGQLSASDGFVSDVVEAVRILGKLCITAKDSIPPPRRGDLAANEVMVQLFEEGIIDAYLRAFGCYPAKTDGGAFHDAMNTFYGCAKYPGSNSFQRMHKAIDRCAAAASHNPVPKQLKAKRGLHPGRRKLE